MFNRTPITFKPEVENLQVSTITLDTVLRPNHRSRSSQNHFQAPKQTLSTVDNLPGLLQLGIARIVSRKTPHIQDQWLITTSDPFHLMTLSC